MIGSQRALIGALAALSTGVLSTGCLDMVVPDEGSIQVTLDPSQLDRKDFCVITVLALDEIGAPVMDGTQIFITTDMGIVLPYGEYEDPEALPLDQHKVNVGTRRGVAMATFYSGEEKGTASISVKSGKHKETSTIVIGRTPDMVLISVQGQSETSGSLLPPEGGSTVITAYVFDENDNPIVQEDVIFSATAGVLESGGGRLVTDQDGSVQDVLTTRVTADVKASLPGSASMAGLQSDSITITVPEPEIVTVVPNFGLPAGYELVSIAGANFAYGARVLFDGLEGIPVNPDATPEEWDSTLIEVYTPPSEYGEEGSVDVVVENPNGYSDTRDAGFAYSITTAP